MPSAVLGPIALVFTLPVVAPAAGPGDVETVRLRLVEHALAASPSANAVRAWIDSLEPDGSWADVDYAGTSRSGWEPAAHTSRIQSMAVAWGKPGSGLAGDERLLAAVLSALDYWIEQDLECPNWWYNEIGVPLALSGALLVLEERLSDEQRVGGLRILERAKLGMTGQNLVWVAQITVARGCLERSPDTVGAAFGAIEGEIRVSEGEGVQADGSFYQHGAQLYSGGYGLGFARDCALFARLADGTAFAFGPEAVAVLSLYLLDGQQWMIRGRQFDTSAVGREITRASAARADALGSACRDMIALDTPRRAEFEAFLARLESDPGAPEPPLVGNRCFWRSDLMCHHRPGYYASVRVTSDRVLQTELVNSENTRGRHLADGVNNLYLDGGEYSTIFPVWDWQALPGTTCERNGEVGVQNGAVGERPFAGGVSDGVYGVQAMDFARGPLTAQKAWFFFDEAYVCLGSGITCSSDHPVVTSVNQCLLEGEVLVGSLAGGPSPRGETLLNRETWVHHDGVGYVFPQPTDIALFADTRVGSWSLIGTGPSDEVRADVFDLRIDHGAGPIDASYAYVVLPGMSARQTSRRASSLGVDILSNTARMQACRHRGAGVTGMVFYEAGTVELAGLPRITVDRPCALLWRDLEDRVSLAAADPSHGVGTLTITVGEGMVLTYDLPEGLLAGRSVVEEFDLH